MEDRPIFGLLDIRELLALVLLVRHGDHHLQKGEPEHVEIREQLAA